MSEEKNGSTFGQKMWLAVVPSIVTGLVVATGIGVQWWLFLAKTTVDQAQLQQKIEADQKQFREKMTVDQKQFFNTMEQSEKQRAKEFRLRFYDRQMAFLIDLSDVVSLLAHAESPTKVPQEIERFYRMANGPSFIMSSQRLKGLIRQFAADYSPLLKNPNNEIPLLISFCR